MNPKLSNNRTKIIWLAAILFLVVPNHSTGVARASAGDLVAEFGLDGKVNTDFANNFDGAFAVATYPDGRIVLVGYSRTTNEFLDYDIAIARYNPDGSLDQTFGDGGRVITDLNEFESASAVAIQPDGKIVVAGSISRIDGSHDFLLIRYNEDGTFDSSFGQGGLVSTDFYNSSDSAADLAITPNGEIIVAGTIHGSTGLSDFALARYKSNGDLDSTFGSDGKVTFGLESAYESLAAMALSSKGEIVLVGDTITPQPETYNADCLVVRLNRDGSPDASFGVDGRVITDFTGVDTLSDVAVTPNDEIVAVGTVEPFPPARFDFVVARYDRHGSLDPSFGTDGHVFTDFSTREDFAFGVAVRPNGKILVAGRSKFNARGFYDDFAVARYNRDGTLDQSFGVGGLVLTDVLGYTDEARAVAILPSGRIIVAGVTWGEQIGPFYPNVDFGMVQYEWK